MAPSRNTSSRMSGMSPNPRQPRQRRSRIDSMCRKCLLCKVTERSADHALQGVTVYRAIKYSKSNIGDWICLPGAGGGLGHLAVQYAVAMGLRVLAIDSGAEKKELVTRLGAEAWVDFKETKDLVADIKAATGGQGPHTAVVTAATGKAYEQAIDYLRPGGTLMVVGLPARATLSADILFTVVKSINIIGSYVGCVSMLLSLRGLC